MARDKASANKGPVATSATTATLGIPNWRDESAYAECVEWKLDRWRWEFLRRWADYRADFEAAAQALETSELWFSHQGARRYELDEFFAPWVSDWRPSRPFWYPLPLPELDEDGLPIRSTEFVNITFDVSKPLAPQMVEAKKQLETEQGLRNLSIIESAQLAYGAKFTGGIEIPIGDIEEKFGRKPRAPKHHIEKWPTYLRALDAREAKASYSDISRLLPKHMASRSQHAARDVLRQARAVCF